MAMTYGALALAEDRRAWIIPELAPQAAIRLKHIFPRVPKTQAPPLVIENTPSLAADLHWFMVRYPLAMPEAARSELERQVAAFDGRRQEMGAVLAQDYTPPLYRGLALGMEVRPYQAQAVEVLRRAGGLLLGDEVGLGKTYVTAAACLLPEASPSVVVCQAHLQKQWLDVLGSFTTLRAAAVTQTRPYRLRPADVYVFRYSQLAGWADVFEEIAPGLAAFDEVQELRTGDMSYKGQAARRLAAVAGLRLGLSATPIYNYGGEIFNIMRVLRPELLGDEAEFKREWCSYGREIRDPAALGAHLRDEFAFLRRTKADVGQQLPAVNRIVDYVDYDANVVRDAEAMARTLAVRATEGSFIERGQAARELDLFMRRVTGLAKAHAVATVVRVLVEGGEPVVLVGWHRDVYDIWLNDLADLNPAMYTGSETPAQKARAKERFVAGETDLFVMSLRTGAGLDGLQTRCSTMVFGELDWSPGIHHQCIGRLDREGQRRPVTALFLVSDDGSDPPMMEINGLKAAEAAQIVDPGLGLQTADGDRSHLQALVRRYLARPGKRGGCKT